MVQFDGLMIGIVAFIFFFVALPWLVIVVAPLLILMTAALGSLTMGAISASQYVLETLKIQSLLERMTEASRGLEDLRKLCACSYEEDGKTHLAIQIATGDAYWSHAFVGEDLASAIDGLMAEAQDQNLFSSKACNSVCANCKRCPKVDFEKPAKEHIMIEPMVPVRIAVAA